MKKYVTRPFRFSPFYGIDGSILVANCGTRVATERDMEWFWRNAESYLDHLTMKMAADERRQGKKLEQWLLNGELDAFNRARGRAA